MRYHINQRNRKLLTILFVAFTFFACVHKVDTIASAPLTIVYNPGSSTVNVGTAGNSVTPVVTGGGGYIFSVSPATPGISIDSVNGVIKWTAVTAAGTYNLTVTVTNIIGSITTTYTLTIVTPAAKPSNLIYTPANDTTSLGIAGQSVVPAINNGGATVTFALTTPPTGVSINATTGVISWTNAVAIGTYSLSVTATNSVGNITATYNLVVNHNLFIPTTPEKIHATRTTTNNPKF